jgi:hypothetical protein
MEANHISGVGNISAPVIDAITAKDDGSAVERIRRSIAAAEAHDFDACLMLQAQRLDSSPVRISGAFGQPGMGASHLPTLQLSSDKRSPTCGAAYKHELAPRTYAPSNADGRVRRVGHGSQRDPHRKNS